MNQVYIYKNSLESLLTLISFLLKNKIKPYNIQDTNFIPSLLDEKISLNLPTASQALKTLTFNNSYLMKTIYYVYLSNYKYKELIIYYLCLNTLKYHEKVLNMYNLKCVNLALKISHEVSNEAHKLKGFIRFQELTNNCLYAKISPTNNVLEILSLHFKKRLKNEYWLIHDTNRGIISIYDKKDYYLVSEQNIKLNLETKDTKYEDLWCTFYDTIGIKERQNDRCRLNFMPKKYWKNILEMSRYNEKSN